MQMCRCIWKRHIRIFSGIQRLFQIEKVEDGNIQVEDHRIKAGNIPLKLQKNIGMEESIMQVGMYENQAEEFDYEVAKIVCNAWNGWFSCRTKAREQKLFERSNNYYRQKKIYITNVA